MPDHADPSPPWLDRAAYPFRSRRWDLPSGDRLHYLDEGAGEPIVFVHGTPTWSFEWRHLVRGLSPERRCLAPDHLGFGLSDRPADAGYAPEDHAERFRAWADALDLAGVTLVVHDFGGPIALPWALGSPDRVRRLIVLDSWMWPLDDDPGLRRKARLAGSGLGRWMYRRLNASLRLIMPSAYGDRAALTPETHRQYLQVFPDPDSRERVLWALARALLASGPFYRSLWERRDRLAGLPALVVWGTEDPAFPVGWVDRWRDALPSARVARLPVGHWPHEEAPADVLTEIRRLLAETA